MQWALFSATILPGEGTIRIHGTGLTSDVLFDAFRVCGRPMGDEPSNAPVEKNFHNWTPTVAGLEIHFADYQFARGLPVVTVPWPRLAGLLAPDMQVLAR